MTFSLEANGSYQSLNFRSGKHLEALLETLVMRMSDLRLGVGLGTFLFLALDLSSDNILPHVIFLG